MPRDRGLARRILLRGFDVMLRRGLRGVWVRQVPPAGALVWAANHHAWWDPFLAAAVLERPDRPACLLMLQENLERFGFVRRLGVFGTDEPRRGLAYLHGGRALVIFPEGVLRPAGPPGELADGAAWYARQAGVPLYAAATRIVLRGHEAPEAYLSFTAVSCAGTLAASTRRLRDALAEGLSEVDSLLSSADPRQPLPGFTAVMRGRRSWDERLQAMAGGRP